MPSPEVVLALKQSEATAGTLYEAIRTRLMIAPELVEIDDVYLEIIPRNATQPLIVMNSITTIPTENAGTVGYWETETIQFTVIAPNDMQGQSLRDSAYKLFTKKPSNPKLLFNDGYDMARHPGKKWITHNPGQGPNANPIWNFIFEVDFVVGRVN